VEDGSLHGRASRANAETPISAATRAAHDQFEAEYLRRYEILVSGVGSKQPDAAEQAAAQVLSAAVAGAIHDAARRGSLLTCTLKQEIILLVRAYLRERRRSG
jgi:hypothetical protein